MIKSVELVDFLSHSDTKLEFDNSTTVFVGQNGAGKSSIIDSADEDITNLVPCPVLVVQKD